MVFSAAADDDNDPHYVDNGENSCHDNGGGAVEGTDALIIDLIGMYTVLVWILNATKGIALAKRQKSSKTTGKRRSDAGTSDVGGKICCIKMHRDSSLICARYMQRTNSQEITSEENE